MTDLKDAGEEEVKVRLSLKEHDDELQRMEAVEHAATGEARGDG